MDDVNKVTPIQVWRSGVKKTRGTSGRHLNFIRSILAFFAKSFQLEAPNHLRNVRHLLQRDQPGLQSRRQHTWSKRYRRRIAQKPWSRQGLHSICFIRDDVNFCLGPSLIFSLALSLIRLLVFKYVNLDRRRTQKWNRLPSSPSNQMSSKSPKYGGNASWYANWGCWAYFTRCPTI